ncbi:hypothetical protein ACFVUR_19305 [Stenotrophomonas bentonitica]|uniref:hypothetical protein n=1 Tax=Stenotrophomonas bentonitica TaxID=1450134 RepID=UPI0036F0979E
MLRRIALATLGLSSIVRGSSYIGPSSPNSAPSQLAFVDEVIPLSWYAVGWIVTGVVALVAVGWPRIQPAGFAFAIGFNLLWAFSFAASWLFLDVPRSYVSATSYATIAVLGFVVAALREKPGPPPVPRRSACRTS